MKAFRLVQNSEYTGPVAGILFVIFILIFSFITFPRFRILVPNLEGEMIVQVVTAGLSAGMFIIMVLSYIDNSDSTKGTNQSRTHLHLHSSNGESESINEITEEFTKNALAELVDEFDDMDEITQSALKKAVEEIDDLDVDNENGDKAETEQDSHVASSDQSKKKGRQPPPSVPNTPEISIDYHDIHIQDMIGAGGSADVHLGEVQVDDITHQMALKQPRSAGTITKDTIQRFLKEVETWHRLDDYKYIVDVIDWGAKPLPWVAMEFMDGGNLRPYLGNLGLNQSLWIAICVTEAVHHAHRHGVAHLDLKPENILFRKTAESFWDVPKVGDWGLASVLIEQTQSVKGFTPMYAAPEQFDPDTFGEPNDRTDIYQLGVVFYELFTGETPYNGKTTEVMGKILNKSDPPKPTDKNSHLPKEIDSILGPAMAHEKSDRYESLLYLRDNLRELYQSER
jgi:hypothetical protein